MYLNKYTITQNLYTILTNTKQGLRSTVYTYIRVHTFTVLALFVRFSLYDVNFILVCPVH